jgi:hypothetical protein
LADTKISALTADTAPTQDDLIVTVTDPAGTPANRKVTLASHAAAANPTSAYASLAAAAWSGRVQWPTDGAHLFRDTGSVNEPWGPIFPLAVPADPGTWVNQGSATITAAKGLVHLACPSNSSNNSVRARVKSTPSVPYTATFLFSAMYDMTDSAGSGIGEAGLCWRESGAGTLVTYTIQWYNSTGNCKIQGSKWNSATSQNSQYINAQWNVGSFSMLWVQLIDDNTNRVFKTSVDGQNWMTVHSVTRTDFLTADQIGICLNPYSCETAMTVFSYKET